jgi:hypothetical protein
MTYYQVEFESGTSSREPKRFRTEEKAKKHAKKVLGIADECGFGTKVTILAVSKNRAPLQ